MFYLYTTRRYSSKEVSHEYKNLILQNSNRDRIDEQYKLKLQLNVQQVMGLWAKRGRKNEHCTEVHIRGLSCIFHQTSFNKDRKPH